MSREPTDPLSFESAVGELWDRLATNAGVNLKEHRLQSLDDLPPKLAAEYQARDDQLAALREKAFDWLFALIFTERVGAWGDDNQRWKRLSLEALHVFAFAKANDEPWRLYVDKQEVARLAAVRWPVPAETLSPLSNVGTVETRRSNRRPGRPPGSGGYAKDDEPLIIEMHGLIETGKARSVHNAAVQVAPKASGTSWGSTVRRLCDRYRNWRRNNGA